MERYIGIDAHLHSCTVAVMSKAGKRLQSYVVETHGSALRACISQIPGKRYICIEEGGFSEWLYEVLEPLAAELVVVQPPRHHGTKNDAIDAWARADELRRGSIGKRVFKSPSRFSELRAAMRTYLMAQDDLARTKHRLKAIFRARGIAASSAVFEAGCREPWLDRLPEAFRRQAVIIGDQLDRIQDTHEEAEAWFVERVERTPESRYLLSMPGIGPIRTGIILGTVLTPDRFRTKRQFWNYCGLAVVTRSSSDWTNEQGHWIRKKVPLTRGLNKNGNRHLKNVFKGAAFLVSRRGKLDQPWRQSYERQLRNGIKPSMALLTLARRIAATTLALWKRKEIYAAPKALCAKN